MALQFGTLNTILYNWDVQLLVWEELDCCYLEEDA